MANPLWYLTTTLLAGYVLSEVACFVVRKLDGHELATLSSMAVATLVIVGVVAANQNNLPFLLHACGLAELRT